MARGKWVREHPSIEQWAITELQVAGFKSIVDKQTIEIRPLTILAGANSSGKSSIIQPLLLLKQTLESSYDPGPLLLDGPNVKFTSAEQLLSRIGKGRSLDSFQTGLRIDTGDSFVTIFRKEHKSGFGIEQMEITGAFGQFTLWPEMSPDEIIQTGITNGIDLSNAVPNGFKPGRWQIERRHSFLEPFWVSRGPTGGIASTGGRPGIMWESFIPEVIHLPGLRNRPGRVYPVAAVGSTYPGTFDNYAASVILQWSEEQSTNLDELNADLRLLKLTGGVLAKRLYDIQLELYVGRLPEVPPTRPENQVNIADVGVGVSQTLPVLVALHAAKPGQFVYVEQPETHLHPRAQFSMAQILANAAKRGVRVVVETHSSILLLGVQTLVAEGNLEADKVRLHWFQREKDGRTVVHPGELDEAGAFGDWPEDFDNVMLEVQKRYLDASDKRMFAR